MGFVWFIAIIIFLLALSFGASWLLPRVEGAGVGPFILYLVAAPYTKLADSGWLRQAKFALGLPINALPAYDQCYLCKRKFGLLIRIRCESCGVEVCTDHYSTIKSRGLKCPSCGGDFGDGTGR